MDIVFHIGANCTDDDRLLKSLLKNGDTFADHGIKVPGPGKYRRLIRETIQALNGAPPAENTRTLLLDEILDGDQPKRLILSNANFICVPNRVFENGVLYDQAETKVRGLLALFPQDNIELCLALRDPATFVPEVFKKSKAATFQAYMKGYHPALMRWSELVRRIRNTAPQCKLTVWCNEDTPLLWPQLIREMSGVPTDTSINGGYDLLSAIMSTEGMTRMLAYMRSHPPQTEPQKHRIIAAFLDKYALDEEIEETVDLPGLSDADVAELTDLYDADVEVISQMDDVNFIEP